MKSFILSLFVVFGISTSIRAQVKVITTSAKSQWKSVDLSWNKSKRKTDADILIKTDDTLQTVEGWGGCFNERGWKAMQYLSDKEQQEIMSSLFSEKGCAFSYCRMPIGASDYALDYYSLNDKWGDYKMDHFSIDRDRKYLLPYIKAAMNVRPDLKVWGSPWTPPSWMKENNRYNQGKIKMDSKTLTAYALYFQKYVEAYRNEGVNIVAVHPQNEPLHLPAFPSCGWSGDQLNVFIRDYLGPRFKQHVPNCEIWLGTINGNDKTDEYNEYVKTVMGDKVTSEYVTGAGFQWSGDSAVEQMIENFPEKKIMQTETKCGWGSNDWKYAMETYNQMVWYLERNASHYLQWNMVLNETGMSSWGWKQNSMVTVDTYNKTYTLNPQYWVVRHFTQFVKPGAKRITLETKEGVQALAFKNVDGQIVLVCSNQTNTSQDLIVKIEKRHINLTISPEHVSTVLL